MKKLLAALLVATMTFGGTFATAQAAEGTDAATAPAETVSTAENLSVTETDNKAEDVSTAQNVNLPDASAVTEDDLEDPGYWKYQAQQEAAKEEDTEAGISLLSTSVSTKWNVSSSGSVVAKTFYHDEKYASGYNIYPGIDVSKWDGDVNWTSVKNAGVKFAIIRTGYRSLSAGNLYADPYLTTYVKNATAAGIPIGFYFFSQALSVKEAQEEANYILNQLNTLKKSVSFKVSLPIVFDYEYQPGGRLTESLSKATKTAACNAFCKVIEDAGYDAMVYANKSMLTNDLTASSISNNYKIWVAQYNSQTTYAGTYEFWQCAETAKVSGISGLVDLNYWYTKKVTTSDDTVVPPADDKDDTVADATAPKKPTLSQSARTETSVTIKWSDVTASGGGYEIYRSDAPNGSYKLIKTVSDGTTSYKNTGLKSGYHYYYKVKPYNKNSAGTKKYGTTSSYATTYTTKNFNLTVRTTTALNIRTGSAATFAKKISTAIPEDTDLTVESNSYDAGGNLWYKVTYKKGSTSYVGFVMAKYTEKVVPVTVKVPTSVKQSGNSTSQIKITWGKVSGASGYQIARSSALKGSYKTIATVKSGTTVSYTNKKLTAGTEYFYKVRAYKVSGGKTYYSSWTSAAILHTKCKTTLKVKTTSNLNMRSFAGTAGALKVTVPKGKTLTVLYSARDTQNVIWYKTTYKTNGKSYTGYLSSRYTK